MIISYNKLTIDNIRKNMIIMQNLLQDRQIYLYTKILVTCVFKINLKNYTYELDFL